MAFWIFPCAACRLGVAGGLAVIPIADADLRRQVVLAWVRDYPLNRAALADVLRNWPEWAQEWQEV